VYYFVFLEPRKDRYWSMTTDPNAELRELAEHRD